MKCENCYWFYGVPTCLIHAKEEYGKWMCTHLRVRRRRLRPSSEVCKYFMSKNKVWQDGEGFVERKKWKKREM